MNIINLILFLSLNSHGFIGFDAGAKEGLDLAKGSTITAMMLEEIANVEENEGISLVDMERALARHDSDANNVIGTGRNIESEYLNLTSTQYLKNSKRKAADNLRKTSRLIKALCALGPDSCTAANAYLMLSEQRQTNELLMEQQKLDKLKTIRQENEKIKKAESINSSLQTIISAPGSFIEKINKGFN